MLAIRGSFSTLGGALLAAALFLALAQLISVPFDVPTLREGGLINFTPQRVDTPVETKRPPKPEPPPNDFTVSSHADPA